MDNSPADWTPQSEQPQLYIHYISGTSGPARDFQGRPERTKSQIYDSIDCDSWDNTGLYGIIRSSPYRWSKEFLEAGKKRLAGDTKREATSSEVIELRAENEQLKQAVAEMLLKNRFLKKTLNVVDSEGSDI